MIHSVGRIWPLPVVARRLLRVAGEAEPLAVKTPAGLDPAIAGPAAFIRGHQLMAAVIIAGVDQLNLTRRLARRLEWQR